MNFESINVSGAGPFAENQSIKFRDRVNVIKGPLGSGKTTIFRALERKYCETYERHNIPVELAVRLVFIGESYGYGEKRGKGIIEAGRLLPDMTCIHLLPTLISHYVNQMIAPKVIWGHSKFSSAERSGFPFQVQMSESNDLQIFNSVGNPVDNLFLAAGESFMLALACNIALRELLQFSDPIVVDGAFGMLDESILSGCHIGIERSVNQSIYLVSEACGERIPVAASNVLAQTDSGKTFVVAECG